MLEAVEQALAQKPRLSGRGKLPLRSIRGAQLAEPPLGAIAGLLQSSRQYFAVTIFLNAGERLQRAASAGPAPRCDAMRVGEGNVGEAAKTAQQKVVPDVARDPQYVKVFAETRSELVTPIKIGTHVLGVVDCESDRPNGFAFEDRVLLQEIATRLAQFLSGRGKYLVMKAREAAQSAPKVSSKQPQSQRQAHLRAAVGEKAHS